MVTARIAPFGSEMVKRTEMDEAQVEIYWNLPSIRWTQTGGVQQMHVRTVATIRALEKHPSLQSSMSV